jgi:hypothetical protein
MDYFYWQVPGRLNEFLFGVALSKFLQVLTKQDYVCQGLADSPFFGYRSYSPTGENHQLKWW